MKNFRVVDLNDRSVLNSEYDLCIVASGYEARSVYLSEALEAGRIRVSLILGFQDLNQSTQRLSNDACMQDHWGSTIQLLRSDEDDGIYSRLRDLTWDQNRPFRILVDYSSMSRIWYAAVLNWALLSTAIKTIHIDFSYSVGLYEENGEAMIIQDMVAIPGCEGGALKLDRSVAVFGLGFNGWASLCVLERLEADRVYAYLASPAAFPEYEAKVIEKNADFIEEQRLDDKILKFPLRSVESSFRYLAELIAPYRNNDEVTLVPMGPKPHVLASILVAMRFPEVSCLRISAKRESPEQVTPTGELICTRIEVFEE